MFDLYVVQVYYDGDNIATLTTIHTSKRRAEVYAKAQSGDAPYSTWLVEKWLPNRTESPVCSLVCTYRAGERVAS